MDVQVMLDWYDHIFIPAVKEEQERTGRKGKVLLLLDNAPSHPPAQSFVREDGYFTVKYLPPNVTSIIQPMDQSVISSLKRLYRQSVLRKVANSEELVAESGDIYNTFMR